MRRQARPSRWMLEAGAVLMRTETELILKSRRVVPGRLLERGFTFRYPHWEVAAKDLMERWRGPVVNGRENTGSSVGFGAGGPHAKAVRLGSRDGRMRWIGACA